MAVEIDIPFVIQGQVKLESIENVPSDLKLAAYVFDAKGRLLGTGKIDSKGSFKLPVDITQPNDVELVIGPVDDPQIIRKSSVYSQRFSANDWIREDKKIRLNPYVFLLRDIWWYWWPRRICISGHVRKVNTEEDGSNTICPVPYVKVEIFDVDRDFCWWPHIRKWWKLLLDRLVMPIPKLVKDPPPEIEPFPYPDPIGPISMAESARSADRDTVREGLTSRHASRISLRLRPEPEPPSKVMRLGPQPEPPDTPQLMVDQSSQAAFSHVGEASMIAPSLASRLDKLTLTSKKPPWLIYPRCFYSKQLKCTTYTDCNGYFNCCFAWWPFYLRRGRLRFDRLPDIIIRVTQVINGVERIIYMDPYTSTRWNVTNAHIDLYLDDEEVVCGPGCIPGSDLGDSQASILSIGKDPVWMINQANGMYTDPNPDPSSTPPTPAISNAAYGGTLYIRGDFSNNLKTGSPKRYYKLSYAKVPSSGSTPQDSEFIKISTPLSALRATPLGTFESYLLGPQPTGTPVAGLYEVQDTAHWWMTLYPYWTTPGGIVIGIWDTRSFETDEGAYILRMEMFDEAGNKMASVQFPDHGGNGTATDPDPVPITADHLDMKIYIDNKPLTFHLTTPAINECGVIKWSPGLTLNFHVHVEQENGRVHRWKLEWTKGISASRNNLQEEIYGNGQSLVDVDVDGSNLIHNPDLNSTCAFALMLKAWSHVRGNWDFMWYGEKVYAIAVEKCP